MNLAIIIARAGSKRIKNKNFKNFLGKPIILYTLEISKKSGLFDHIVITSDYYQIKNLIKVNKNISIENRPKFLAGDKVKTLTVIKHILKKKNYKKFNYICCLYPASPLIQKKNLEKTYAISKKNKNFCFPSYSKSIDKNKFNKRREYTILNKINEDIYIKKQNITVKDSGQFYWAPKKIWVKTSNIISKGVTTLVIDGDFSQDLNTYKDWEITMKKYKNMKKKNLL